MKPIHTLIAAPEFRWNDYQHAGIRAYAPKAKSVAPTFTGFALAVYSAAGVLAGILTAGVMA